MSSLPQRAVLSGVCLLATFIVSGCQDASSDPLALILTDETLGALAVDGRLPSLGSLVAQAHAEPALSGPLDLWSDSWQRAPEEGRELRLEAYQRALGPLTEALDQAALQETVESVGEAIQAASSLDPEALGTRIINQVELAKSEQNAALVALGEQKEGEALAHTLLASDLLREVGPESVIRVLLHQAEGTLGQLRGDPSASSSEDFRRGERLLRGARAALETGDYARAIRRAYYACQVLGIQPD